MISAGASLRQTNTFQITRIGVSEVAVSQQMVVLHHLLLNGLPEPPHRRSFPPVAWWLITLRVSETRDHQLNISLGFISISISHCAKRSQKSMNMSATNDYEGRNSPCRDEDLFQLNEGHHGCKYLLNINKRYCLLKAF
jgi:hypothetical protein